ncbi:MAG: hypothetical protein U1F77_18550 [Kiritimatiellia bacterium]
MPELDKTYDLKVVEGARYARWEAGKAFHARLPRGAIPASS